MYTISDAINTEEYDGLQITKISHTDSRVILLISLEKDAIFKKHLSPRDAHLIVLEGSINFHINDTSFVLNKHQVFDFPKNQEHWVEARCNSKFLVLR